MRDAPLDSSPLELREAWRASRDATLAQFDQHRQPKRLLRQLSLATDRTLRALLRSFPIPADAALIAVGGYGRGEMYPNSDVDLLLLRPEIADSDAAYERFVSACWDLGFEIGHSVRTVQQCLDEAQADITVQTALLESRWLAGSRTAAQNLVQRLDAALDPRRFLQGKLAEMRQRHARYENTPYSLEPNCKESPGGLRDLQVVLWMSRASGFGRSWTELGRAGLISHSEARGIAIAERTLAQIRIALHRIAGRRDDRLGFDLQAGVANTLGFSAVNPATTPIRGQRQASEALMQRYYRAAKLVTQATSLIVSDLELRLAPSVEGAEPVPIDHEFQDIRGNLDVRDVGLFERDPSAILRAFLAVAKRPALGGMTSRTLRAIWRARARVDARFRQDPANRALFMSFMQMPTGITRGLRLMNQWSVLGRYLPEFRRIVGRMQHDLFHVYTVDQHILTVVRNLRRFFLPQHAHEYPFCSELAASFDQPWRLSLAALYHDIAKGRGGDHSELGRQDALKFCRRHGVSNSDAELVAWLVDHHLRMSSIAQKQDVHDPDVIDSFAQFVQNDERLVALYLLTVADIRGTSPKVWNAWKAKLLEDLFRGTRARLVRGREGTELHEDNRRTETVHARKQEAIRLMRQHTLDEEAWSPLWNVLDTAYFLRHEPIDIAWHVRALWRHLRSSKAVIKSRVATVCEGFQVVVWIPEQPELFARICEYFDLRGLSVLDARVTTTRGGWALDQFLVTQPDWAEHARDILNLIETELLARLASPDPMGPPVRGRPSRRSRFFPVEPAIELVPDGRGERWLLSVRANDRTGLLYAIARVFAKHQINLHTARITTLGERAEDTFLVEGAALATGSGQIQFQTELLAALAGP